MSDKCPVCNHIPLWLTYLRTQQRHGIAHLATVDTAALAHQLLERMPPDPPELIAARRTALQEALR